MQFAMRYGYIILLLAFHIASFCALAQSSQKIEILGADALKLDTLHRARKLVGNVRLRQHDVIMACDSALFYSTANAVDAFGHVYIHDKQTKVYADTLQYDGTQKTATLLGNVRIIHDSAAMQTTKLIYNTEWKQAAFFDGGIVTAQDMTITSRRGYFYASTKEAHFGGNVKAHGTAYELLADTLKYNTDTEVSYFFGPTEIIRTNERIYCESGWHDTQTGISVFGKHTRLWSEAQTIEADSLYYDNRLGYGMAYRNFRWTDTTMHAILSGNRAVYYTRMQRIIATDSALLTYLIDDDSLFLSADTLKSLQDTVNHFTEFFAYPRVKVFKTNLQGVCDSLAFSFRDSTIRMYKNPVIWNNENQLTGDTIALLLRNGKLHQAELYDNGFIASQALDGLFNQIKGRRISGYFKDGRLNRLLAEGNGESIYYGTDDADAFIGLNKAACSSMWIFLDDERVSRITFLTLPDAVFYPIQSVKPAEFLLKGFAWKKNLRPASKNDLFARESPSSLRN